LLGKGRSQEAGGRRQEAEAKKICNLNEQQLNFNKAGTPQKSEFLCLVYSYSPINLKAREFLRKKLNFFLIQ
jgi:hypothetical protein